MTKRTRILYWITTAWLCLGMLSSGIVQLLQQKEQVELFQHLGYPLYFLSLLAVAKFGGVAVLLAPRLPLLKEWAYAGFFFLLIGAVASHLATGSGAPDLFPPLLLLLLNGLSWHLRPAPRKTLSITP